MRMSTVLPYTIWGLCDAHLIQTEILIQKQISFVFEVDNVTDSHRRHLYQKCTFHTRLPLYRLSNTVSICVLNTSHKPKQMHIFISTRI